MRTLYTILHINTDTCTIKPIRAQFGKTRQNVRTTKLDKNKTRQMFFFVREWTVCAQINTDTCTIQSIRAQFCQTI